MSAAISKTPQPMQVLTSRGTVNYYTPPEYVELAREVLGSIDLDPASCERPQLWIRAARYFTEKENGLDQEWHGRVFLNPPFDNTALWVKKLVSEYECGNVAAAIALVNSNLGYCWYEHLWTRFPVCCATRRISFIREDGTIGGQAKRGQSFVFLGSDVYRFRGVFESIGRVIVPDNYDLRLFQRERRI